MTRWYPAPLTARQVAAIRELEERLGFVLVAYSHAVENQAEPDFAAALEPAPGVLAALNETYQTNEPYASAGEESPLDCLH